MFFLDILKTLMTCSRRAKNWICWDADEIFTVRQRVYVLHFRTINYNSHIIRSKSILHKFNQNLLM